MSIYTLTGASTMTLAEGTLAASPVTVTAVTVEADRAGSPNTATDPTYYIRITHDVNSHLSFEGAGTGDNADDAWGMSTIKLAKVTTTDYTVPTTVSYKLAGGESTGSQNVGTITIKDNTDGSNTTKDTTNFNVQADFVLKENGSYAVSLSITGNDYTLSSVLESDDYTKAQVVHWDFEDVPTVTATTADNFSLNTLTASNLQNDPDIELEENQSSDDPGSVFSAWTLDVSAVNEASNSQLAKIANTKGYSHADVSTTAGSLSLFATGEKLLVSGANIGGTGANQIKLNYKLNGSASATAVASFDEIVSFVLVQS
jgi:hypothetical protein